jgi:hypothetical protein
VLASRAPRDPYRDKDGLVPTAPRWLRDRPRGSRSLPALAGLATLLAAVAAPAASAAGPIETERVGIRALEVELSTLDARTGGALAAEERATSALSAARAQVRANAAELRRLRREHRAAQVLLAKRLVAIYRHRPPSLIEILLSTGGLASTLDASRSLQRIGELDDGVVRQLEGTRRRMAAARVALLAERRAAAQALVVATARRRRLQAVAEDRRAALERSRRTLGALSAQEARRRAAAAAQARAARLAALRAARARVDTRLSEDLAAPAPVLAPPPPAGSAPSQAVLDRIAQCESGGNPSAVSAGGQYRGKYQFDPSTWRANGGTGDPARAPEAVQDRVAARLYAARGSAPWPICGR